MKLLLSKLQLPVALSAVVFAAGLAAPSANADQWNKRTILTVNQTIQVEDAVLPPGQYVLRLLDSNSDRHVVQIFNGRENHVVATILAIPKERLNPTGETQFTFWETPGGTARAMRDWFYPGDLTGQEFTYPKHPYQLAMAAPPAAPMAAPPETAPEPAPPAVDTTPQPETQPSTPETAQPEQAQPEQAPADQAPPDQAPAPPQDAAPAPAPAPAELPHTSSPYPLLGISGLALLGLGSLLRLRRLPLR
jgi:LPXTG-motif cell wall-anchored protein